MLSAKKGLTNQIISYEKQEDCLIIATDTGKVRVTVFSDRIVRITYTKKEEFVLDKSLGIVSSPQATNWKVDEKEAHILVQTDKLTLFIRKDNCGITYKDSNGEVLTKEPDTGGKILSAYDAYKTNLDEGSLIQKVETADGIKEVVVNANKSYYKELYSGKICFEWDKDEALYGLGQQEEGVLNLRGHRQYLHQANMKIPVPFMVSSRNYGILFDTYSPMIFNDNEYGSYLYTESVEELDYYFIHGETFDKVISGYRTLTGTASMLPKWAFGYIQSCERYESAKELVDTVGEYRKRNIPIDCIILDWQSWEGEKWGQKTFDKERFEDPRQMVEDLHAQDVHFMMSIWPNMRKGTENYLEFKEKGGLFQRSEIYDAFDEDARALYWQQVSEGLFCHGVDGWWTDSSEPFAPEWSQKEKPEPDKNYMKYHETAKTYVEETLTNAYPLVHAKTIFEGQREETLDKRVINLTRSAYTGQQRYGNIMWSGDISAKWSTLKAQIAAGLNFCASGIPYWTLDIGAFFTKQGDSWFWNGDFEEGCLDPKYRELYTRWFQYATFLPIFRAHGTDTRREVWQFGEQGETYYDTLIKFIELRYELMPYIYSMAGRVTQEDYTMMRLLAFNYNQDPKVHDIVDQYLFGEALMVCPVTEPMYELEEALVDKSRKVYLPEESSWYDYWTNKCYKGGQTITAEAPIEKIPLYVKSGAIIPKAKVAGSTRQSSEDVIELYIYSGDNGEFTLYQDENDSYNYETGNYSMIKMQWKDEINTLMINDRVGGYNNMPQTMTFKVYIDNQYKSSIIYTGKEVTYFQEGTN